MQTLHGRATRGGGGSPIRVLLTGANGFIGSHILTGLVQAGHEVVAAVRVPESLQRRFPAVRVLAVDLNTDTRPEIWKTRLDGIDAVVNCAGILQAERGQSIEAIHHTAPAALFTACAKAGVRRVIQVSAISADERAGTDYALSKWRGDEALRQLDLEWVVLRPSLIYGEGSYGGTSLLRGLAGLPWVIPVVGDGAQPFQPLHVEDFVRAVLVILDRPDITRITLEPAGPERLTFVDIIQRLRAWLGFGRAQLVHVPVPLVRFVCRIGDRVGAGPMRTTALDQLQYGNAGPAEPFIAAVGFTPRTMHAALDKRPAMVQDRWHARLFFVRPMLTLLLAALWLGSGVIGLLVPWQRSGEILSDAGMSTAMAGALGLIFSLIDIAMAGAIVFGRQSALIGWAQIALIAGFTAILTVAMPSLWLDPFGPLLKNLPIIGAILAWMAIGDDR